MSEDRMREALELIAAMPDVQRNPDGEDQAAATMKLIAREALAAAPANEKDDPAASRALRTELWNQWEYNHAEHCGKPWPHEGECYWPLPDVLSRDAGTAAPGEPE